MILSVRGPCWPVYRVLLALCLCFGSFDLARGEQTVLVPQTEGAKWIPETRVPEAVVSTKELYAVNQDVDQLAALPALLDALEVMQSQFFDLYVGIWPRAIEWTAAVMGTQVSASLEAFSTYLMHDTGLDTSGHLCLHENLINRYFTQVLSFYFAEDTIALRGQAFDDMLWVVLGWLETINLVNRHSDLHYADPDFPEDTAWHAKQWIPNFAHRARIFYDLASDGWDTSLCGGGMIWSPYLKPYKNAITNQLYISASIKMYLYFPGDDNTSPFMNEEHGSRTSGLPPVKRHDSRYLEAAIEAYRWLSTSNMTNSDGLYVDGFHTRGYQDDKNIGTGQCDIRNEKVYTYNQGVILSGLRGLWEATGMQSYLEDGHALIRNTISATGWSTQDTEARCSWAGIGRYGVLEEICDSTGSCDQNGQTFKGIFFLHMAAFCAPLPVGVKEGVFFKANKELAMLHRTSCLSYGPWIKHNAEAAYKTRDDEGKYGMWWTHSLCRRNTSLDVPSEGIDYRNYGIPDDEVWRIPGDNTTLPYHICKNGAQESGSAVLDNGPWDPNARGRGRTVETQSGGVSVLRALYKLSQMNEA